MLAHRSPLVNNFFQILLEFFIRCFHRKQPVTAECLANIAPEEALVNTFFAIFSDFFRALNLVVFQCFQPLNRASRGEYVNVGLQPGATRRGDGS